MDTKLKIVQYGLGPIGMAAAKLVLTKPDLQLVGGIDINPDLVGKDLGEILETQGALNIPVSDDPESLLRDVRPDVVLHCTNSFLTRIEPQLMQCLGANASVISSCEELFYPFRRDPEFCERIDTAAKKTEVVVVGTGVNPGFAMDVLPLAVSGICTHVEKVEAVRISDAARRRLPLQKKVGAGLTPEEFKEKVDAGKLGHIGLLESLYAVADGIGFKLDNVRETLDPAIAETTVKTEFMEVKRGQVAGIVHRARGFAAGEEVVTLDLQMYVGAQNEQDRVRITGTPPIDLHIAGGIFGDSATIARMVNVIPAVRRARPGLLTVMDLPLTTFYR